MSENIKNKILISNDRSIIKYNLPKNLTNKNCDTLRYAILAYSFVMFPSRCFTYAELAEKIKISHDMNEVHNKTCFDILIISDELTK
jgi:hypothetical protein